MSETFTDEHITDAKRIVRGEQYLYARSLLRARDIERIGPRILTLAGGAPKEELSLIRELWSRPAAHVTAVDRVADYVKLAIEAGADNAHMGELESLVAEFPSYKNETIQKRRAIELLKAADQFGDKGFTYSEYANIAFSDELTAAGSEEGRIFRSVAGILGRMHKKQGLIDPLGPGRYRINEAGKAFLSSFGSMSASYDLIALDLCGGVNRSSRDLMRACARGLTDKGCIMLNFSYGRDVSEAFAALVRNGDLNGEPTSATRIILKRGLPDTVAGRLAFLAQNGTLRLRSVILYRGNESPMCSSLWQRWWDDSSRNKDSDYFWPQNLRATPDCSFSKVGDGDYEDVIENFDAAQIYACPEERLLSIRRKVSARKAVATKRTQNANGRGRG